MATTTKKAPKRRKPATSGPVHMRNMWKLTCGKTRVRGDASTGKVEEVTCEECKAKLVATKAALAAKNLATSGPATNGAATNGPAMGGVINDAPGFLPSTTVLKAKVDFMNTVLDDIYAKIARVMTPEADYVKRLILQTKS